MYSRLPNVTTKRKEPHACTIGQNIDSNKPHASTVEFLFPKIFFGTIGFWLADGIRCLEPEAQNTVLSLEVAKIQFL